MRTRPLLILIGIFAVAAALAVGGSGTGKSKSSKSIAKTKTPQGRVVQPDPPGTIDGAVNPELIPDHAAYTVVFRSLALREDTDFERRRATSWAQGAGLDEERADALLTAANEFQQRVSALDQQVREIKDRTWPKPSAEVMAQLTDLQRQKEEIVGEIVASLPVRLGEEGAEKLRQRVNNHVKQKMKIAPVRTSPPSQHH